MIKIENNMKSIRSSVSIMLLFCLPTIKTQAQDDFIRNTIEKRLNDGDCETAEFLYKEWGKKNKTIELDIYNCKYGNYAQLSDNNVKLVIDGVTYNLIYVEGGTFNMGSQKNNTKAENYDPESESDENPVHSVTLSSFYIGQTEVMQELWRVIMNNNPSVFVGDKNPVENVSWRDCQEFIKRLKDKTSMHFRLPTEAEWEYAARGGNRSLNYLFSGDNTIDNVGWYYGNSNETTHPVGLKKPNELGIYDMSGNVSEICGDRYGHYYPESQYNPEGAEGGTSYVLRGGSSFYSSKNCRVTERSGIKPDDKGMDGGFRLVLTK